MLSLLLQCLLTQAYSHRPGPAPIEVCGVGLVPLRSQTQACFFGIYFLIPAPVEDAGLGPDALF